MAVQQQRRLAAGVAEAGLVSAHVAGTEILPDMKSAVGKCGAITLPPLPEYPCSAMNRIFDGVTVPTSFLP